MQDNILKILKQNANFDSILFPVTLIGRYVAENIDKPAEKINPESIKTLVFPDRKKIESKKLEKKLSEASKYIENKLEKQKVDEIRKKMFL